MKLNLKKLTDTKPCLEFKKIIFEQVSGMANQLQRDLIWT